MKLIAILGINHFGHRQQLPYPELNRYSVELQPPFCPGLHALRRRADGELAVDLPALIRRQFTRERTRLSWDHRQIGEARQALLLRMIFHIKPGRRFGVRFQGNDKDGQLVIDSEKGEACFLLPGSESQTPHVAFPTATDGVYSLELVTDPRLGLGVAYINQFRALSFRFYDIRNTSLSLFADEPPVAVDGTAYVR